MGRMPFQSCVIKEQEELHKDSSGVVGRRRGKDGLVHRHRGPHTRVQEGKQQQGHFLNVFLNTQKLWLSGGQAMLMSPRAQK